MRQSGGDTAFYAVNYLILAIILVLVLYPLIYIVSCSFSSPQRVTSGDVWLYPVKPTLLGYETIFRNRDIMTGYANATYYTVTGTILSVVLTLLAGYPLSRPEFRLGNAIMLIFAFTMFFGGGIIPSYLLINSLGMANTRAAIILPGALSVYNVILTRTFIRSNIPDELHEASMMDGCSHFAFFLRVLLPLSKAIIAVIALFSAVAYWNSYFSALIYLHDRAKYPLQLILREILIQNRMTALEVASGLMTPEQLSAKQAVYELLKYSLIIVASLPVLCVYPFIQRYFVKGVMLGALKG